MVQLLTSLANTRFVPSIEPITFPTPSRCATCYAKDADLKSLPQLYVDTILQIFNECIVWRVSLDNAVT